MWSAATDLKFWQFEKSEIWEITETSKFSEVGSAVATEPLVYFLY